MSLASTTRDRIVGRLGAAHIAGATLEDALRVAEDEVADGASATVGLWSYRGDPPAGVAEQCAAAVSGIARLQLPATVSVKLPDLGFATDEITALLRLATQLGVGVHLDSMRSDDQGQTMEMLPELLADHPDLGVTLPGRWPRSVADLERVVGAGVRSVRLVKGQWPDARGPGVDPRAGVSALVDALAGSEVEVGVATHDLELARRSLRRLRQTSTRCRLEQLYGLPRLGGAALPAPAPSLVVYVPYGAAYLPYALRQALRHPSVLRWAARDLLRASPRRRGAQAAVRTGDTGRADPRGSVTERARPTA